jgi:hypothetical protein
MKKTMTYRESENKKGTSLQSFIESTLNEQEKSCRPNRFMDDSLLSQKRSLSASLTERQKREYESLRHKSIKRDRSELSYRRYSKMRNLIMVEVKNAIQEAEYEPTCSFLVESTCKGHDQSDLFLGQSGISTNKTLEITTE